MGTLFEDGGHTGEAWPVSVALCFGNNTTNGSVVNVYLDDGRGHHGRMLAFEVMPNMIAPAGGITGYPSAWWWSGEHRSVADCQITGPKTRADTVAVRAPAVMYIPENL